MQLRRLFREWLVVLGAAALIIAGAAALGIGARYLSDTLAGR
jgi:hypothetical protein